MNRLLPIAQPEVVEVEVVDGTLTDSQRDEAIRRLRGDAVRVLQRTLRTGIGNRTAVDLAKWVLYEAGKSATTSDPAEIELNNVLRLVVNNE
jgi:hypothetical protein